MVIIVMGVSGCGKSTVGEQLAAKLGGDFHDADHYHPASNVAKMRSGVPLNDDDRKPWLETLASEIRKWQASGRHAVLACSALKKSYRRILNPDGSVRLVFLTGTRELLLERMQGRKGHFMPATLLDTQLATLQAPEADESPVVIDISDPPDTLVEKAATALLS